MSQDSRLVELEEKRLVGMSREMSHIEDQTPALWRSFMPRRGEITNRTSRDFISMQVYPNGAAQVADPAARFTKWAVVEVRDHDRVPDGMQPYTLTGGPYAVFVHHGPATDLSTIGYIYQEWLPNSEFLLDDREQFEVLPEGYDPFDPNAHEEIWVPVRARE